MASAVAAAAVSATSDRAALFQEAHAILAGPDQGLLRLGATMAIAIDALVAESPAGMPK
jgi:hypothetical protein